MTAQTKEVKRIESYSLLEFAEKVQEAVLEGYRLDVGSNENAPISFGSFQTCGMVKEAPEVVPQAVPKIKNNI